MGYTLHFSAYSGGWSYQFTPLTPAVHWKVGLERDSDTDRVTAIIETWTIDALFYGDVDELWTQYNALVAKLEALEPFHVELKYDSVTKRKLQYLGASAPSSGRRVHSIQVLEHSVEESDGGKANNLRIRMIIKAKQYTGPVSDDAEPPQWIRRSYTIRKDDQGVLETWTIWVKSEAGLRYVENWREEYRNGRDLDEEEITYNIDEGTWTGRFSVRTPEGDVYEWNERINISGGGQEISFVEMSNGKEPVVNVGPKRGFTITVSVRATADDPDTLQKIFGQNWRNPKWIKDTGGFSGESGDIVPEGGICIPRQAESGRAGKVKIWAIEYTQIWRFSTISQSVLEQFGLAEPKILTTKSKYTPIWGNP